MESRIPVPTDNIFKFYALFGLLLFVFALGSVLYVNRTTNEEVFSDYPELEGLKQMGTPSQGQRARIEVLERKLEINQEDKKSSIRALGVLASVSVLLMFYGFRKWHKEIQPVLDKTAKVQLEIALLQLEKLRREISHPTQPTPPTEPDPLPAAAPR